MSAEGSLVDMLRGHRNLMVATVEVKLREPASAIQFVEKLICGRDWKSVLYYHGVQSTVVYTETPRPVFFSHKEDERGESTGARLDKAFVK